MFSIIWEFIINILESSLFAIIANASFQKREYKNSILKQFAFLSFKSIFITILNIEIVSTMITIIAVEYSCAAEPPVQCSVSHLSRRSEPQ